MLLQDWVRHHAETRPEALAIVFGDEKMTYGELDRLSSQLANRLRTSGCLRGDRVCIAIPRSPAAITAILGTLKADAIYVPLDPASPAVRAQKILESCENRWILTEASVAKFVNELLAPEAFATVSVGTLDAGGFDAEHFQTAFSAREIYQQPEQAPESANRPEDLAYIMFTSGSTGTPKGVPITHDNVIRFTEWGVDYFDVEAGDRHSGHIPLHFDLSVYDMFGAFAGGAELHLVPPEVNLLPHKLAGFIRDSALNQWFSVPSILNYMAKFDVIGENDFPALRRLLWCGEVLPTPVLKYWMERLPHVKFTNLYGPTEATIASSYYTVPACPVDETAEIPIGRACPGEDLLVLDEKLDAAPVGELGDLYIRGVGLSPGYWRDPAKTAEVFVTNPAQDGDRLYKTGDLARVGTDGLVYFHGRADYQIKSRGYRIELGEIETALNALGELRECAVVAVETDRFEGAIICCAFCAAEGREVTPLSIRKSLGNKLPGYMIPARWLELDVLPKNANGKIDRNHLKESFRGQPAESA